MFGKKLGRLKLATALLGGLATIGCLVPLGQTASAAGQQFTMPMSMRAEGTFATMSFRTWLSAPVIVELSQNKLGASDWYGPYDPTLKTVNAGSGTEFA